MNDLNNKGRNMASSKAIDIIIPVYKNASLTKHCIDSILQHISEIQQLTPRLLLINDSPDDQEVNSILEELAVSNPNVILLTNPKNLGFVKSVNRGFTVSIRDGRDVILINSDTETFEGTLVNLVDAAYSDPQIGFVSPRSNNASLSTLPHSFYSAIPLSPEETYKLWREISATLPKFHFTPTVVGFYMFIKHKVLANFGGLREDFGLGYEEENELVLRANKVGYRAALANRSFAFHAGSASFNLLDLDLHTHRNNNLQKMCAFHPEFLPLVHRYQSSAHFRAESLLSGLIGHSTGSTKVIIDLSGLGCYHNGTSELALGIVKSLGQLQEENFDFSILCSPEAYKFHKLDKLENISLADQSDPGKHAIAIRLGQPYDVHNINVLESLAPINVYGMLDTISEDCGHLSITQNITDLWTYVARHANGLFFISQFSEQTFHSRFPDSQAMPKYTRLLPTRLSSYAWAPSKHAARHVLILGNHYPHKASDDTAEILSKAFPTVQFVVLGANTFQRDNLRGYRSGTVEQETISNLFLLASIVILPSYVEGFGFGLMHALAAHKPVVARNIDATNEILGTFNNVEGVYLYNNDTELHNAFTSAIKHTQSMVDDSAAIGWEEWADGLAEFFTQLVSKKDIFPKLCNRIYASDQLRKIAALEKSADSIVPEKSLEALLQREGSDFVDCIYMTFLNRKPDTEGLLQNLSLLQQGVPKIEIVDGIRNSPEGRMVGKELA